MRVLRGGAWINNQDNCRAAYRNRNIPNNRNNNIGFRLCLSSHIVLRPVCSGLPGHIAGIAR
ncbi:MAG: SUMF1/EgtB/PvdO family nonheme iron enzyme [Gammaproteobacteria bacterium]|nr:SUMF1/EgtB/PvdO family nonheme iron enzyme [Gammaproteobacteria bacterium]